jgi:hypothetical protein
MFLLQNIGKEGEEPTGRFCFSAEQSFFSRGFFLIIVRSNTVELQCKIFIETHRENFRYKIYTLFLK